jgi:hypothetical protein
LYLIKEEFFCHLFSGSEIFVPEAVDDAHECEAGGNDDEALKGRRKNKKCFSSVSLHRLFS